MYSLVVGELLCKYEELQGPNLEEGLNKERHEVEDGGFNCKIIHSKNEYSDIFNNYLRNQIILKTIRN